MIRDILVTWGRLVILILALAGMPWTGGALAQSGNPFAPVAIVNDRPITGFELAQRVSILQMFGTAGDLQEVALEQLIEDRLRLDAVAIAGLDISPEDVNAGMEEFAGRANMQLDEFVQSLAARGVSRQTLRDFVRAGVGWRAVVQQRFGPRARVTEAEVDRAIALTSQRGGAVVELAEIYLPARDPAEQEQSRALALELGNSISTTGAFAAAARQYSVAPTGPRGGRTGRAVPISELPPPLRSQVLALAPGDVSEPVQGGNVIAIFQLISLRETGATTVEDVSLEYAEYLIPGGRTEETLRTASKVAARVDTCDDLYGVNRNQSAERLQRQTLPVADVPRDIAMELAKLDEGEVSTALTRGGNLVFLMLCGRTPALEEAPDRAQVQRQLTNQRLAAYGDGYLAQLRADAIIRYP